MSRLKVSQVVIVTAGILFSTALPVLAAPPPEKIEKPGPSAGKGPEKRTEFRALPHRAGYPDWLSGALKSLPDSRSKGVLENVDLSIRGPLTGAGITPSGDIEYQLTNELTTRLLEHFGIHLPIGLQLAVTSNGVEAGIGVGFYGLAGIGIMLFSHQGQMHTKYYVDLLSGSASISVAVPQESWDAVRELKHPFMY